MAFCTLSNKIMHSDEPVKKLEDYAMFAHISPARIVSNDELIKKLENVTDRQPQYIQLQFDFMKDFENSKICQMKN